jgi:trans-aconitate 2-methyltransferase
MVNNEHSASREEVEKFYDTFKGHQKKLGVNIRHRIIFKNLKKLGLRPDSNVLEIGCGIGTVSSLILNLVTKGVFTGVDISRESIEMARHLNKTSKNAEFIVNDMGIFSHSVKFDYIVLPDVLEHIPVEQHYQLFQTLSKVSSPEAVVLINIPEPNILNWVRKKYPEKLQIIDQSLSMQDLLNNSYPHGFRLFSMHSYSLQYVENDYTSVVLKKDIVRENYEIKDKFSRAVNDMLSKF